MYLGLKVIMHLIKGTIMKIVYEKYMGTNHLDKEYLESRRVVNQLKKWQTM